MLTRVAAFLHRAIWRKLPRGIRRRWLFGVQAMLAPRPTTHPVGGGPLIVAGTLRTASGLGESARLCYDALAVAGFDVYGIDLTEALMQPLDAPGFAFVDGRHLTGAGTIVLHVNAPLVPMAMRAIGRRTVRDKRIVGYWAWELPGLPDDWQAGTRFVHAVWTPSSFSARAIAPAMAGRPVDVLFHPIACREIQAAESVDGRFTALVIFNMTSSFARKNPDAAVAAYCRAFGEDEGARLVVKVSNADAFVPGIESLRRMAAGRGDIEILEGLMETAEMDALYASADVVMSLHRSEGFGLVIAEAMLRGLPTIATDWSGSADFFTDRHGFPVKYRLIPAEDRQGTYDHPGMVWADPDISAAASALRRLRDKPDEAGAMGQAARHDALDAFGAAAYGKRVVYLLGRDG